MTMTMTPHVDGHGATTIMRMLPGSHRMVGGPHVCMYIETLPMQLDDWRCDSVYMHVAYEPARPYVGTDCLAVLRAVNEMNATPQLAAEVLLRGEHARGHPLPGVYTVRSSVHRVDMRAYEHEGRRHLWAEVYRSPDHH